MVLEVPAGVTLYIARHGETQANVEKRYQGCAINTALTEKGIAQADEIAAILRASVSAPVELDFVSSPLERAVATMQLVRAALGLAPDGFRTDPRLREIDLGFFDGLTDAEAAARYPKEYAARQADKWNISPPGSQENYATVSRRMSDFVMDLGRDTFAISHGAATRVLRGLLAGMNWQQMSALDEPQGCVFRMYGSEVVRLDARTPPEPTRRAT